jgi:hypothetical protein
MARRMSMNYVEVADVISKVETSKALLVEIEGEDYWIPKSVIVDESEVYKDSQQGTLCIAEWYAKKAGLDGG